MVSTAVGDVESVVDGIDGCYIIEPEADDIANKLELALDSTFPFGGREKMRRYSILRQSFQLALQQISWA